MTDQRCYGKSPLDASRAGWIVLAVAAFAGSVVRWQQLWFLTDDADIAFRYVSNELLGHGLVWKPAPFERVEGDTRFSWVLLLGAVWWLAAADAPHAANWLPQLCGCGARLVGRRFLMRMRLPASLESIGL